MASDTNDNYIRQRSLNEQKPVASDTLQQKLRAEIRAKLGIEEEQP